MKTKSVPSWGGFITWLALQPHGRKFDKTSPCRCVGHFYLKSTGIARNRENSTTLSEIDSFLPQFEWRFWDDMPSTAGEILKAARKFIKQKP